MSERKTISYLSFRALGNLTDDEKNREIWAAKQHLSAIKQAVLNVLANNNIVIKQ